MKRYNHYAFCKTCDGDAQSWMEEEPDGMYALVSDVSAQMVPRPDREKVERLIDKVVSTARQTVTFHDVATDICLAQARSDLLKLVGVEVE
jgi:hypothetical protein